MTDAPAEFALPPDVEARLREYDPDPTVPLPAEPSIEDEQYLAHVERGLSRLPAKYADADLDLCDPRVREWCDGWLAGDTRSLLLNGPTGTGKTFAAYAAMRYLIAAGLRHIERYTEPQLLGRIRTQLDASEMILSYLESSDLVFLDDLGSAKHSEWTEELIYRVIDSRYQADRPVLVATNVPFRDLSARLGDRVASRLAEMCVRVPLVGADRRLS